ncbi:unnamed protein product [Plutella xylostella]|uniref:(diamondback moth) hypothetical protein n=1 Tax=Plutella xylostella TaxID=51655 RepID=A0A8S4CY08_PLUXY|nr:unnamed protein product [Plutella xylostella]
MPELKVTSEIYSEYDYQTTKDPSIEGNVISEFPFLLPKKKETLTFDEDSDLDMERPKKEVIRIEHSPRTNIALVGLQVWRGAFLLGDLLISLGLRGELAGRTVLELGAGTGITSFVASMYAKRVVCTGTIRKYSTCGPVVIISLGLRGELAGRTVLELGAGTGITSFVASMYAERVVCTGEVLCF